MHQHDINTLFINCVRFNAYMSFCCIVVSGEEKISNYVLIVCVHGILIFGCVVGKLFFHLVHKFYFMGFAHMSIYLSQLLD